MKRLDMMIGYPYRSMRTGVCSWVVAVTAPCVRRRLWRAAGRSRLGQGQTIPRFAGRAALLRGYGSGSCRRADSPSISSGLGKIPIGARRRLRRPAELRLVRIEEIEGGAVLYPGAPPLRRRERHGDRRSRTRRAFPIKITPERATNRSIVYAVMNINGPRKTPRIPNEQASTSSSAATRGAGRRSPATALRRPRCRRPPSRTSCRCWGGVEAKLDGAKPELIIDARFADGAHRNRPLHRGAGRRRSCQSRSLGRARRRHAALCAAPPRPTRRRRGSGQASDPDARVG